MQRQLPSHLLEQQFFQVATRQASHSESIRPGAPLMLQKAVELEVTEFLGRKRHCWSVGETLRPQPAAKALSRLAARLGDVWENGVVHRFVL